MASHKHTGKQHRGDKMHAHSKPGHDSFRSPGPHAGDKEHSIAHGYNPPEEYQEGPESGNETCEHE